MHDDLKDITNTDLRHIVRKCLDVKDADGPGALSTGEALAAAIVLNRPEWLARMNYTLAEAIDRIDDSWLPLLRKAERIIKERE
ncbi:hypothetical protein AB3X94_37410 [Paraburkholderia sp. BR10923]|uniref:hypothetical protein n=1 Tax=Paraburkholderia sp. BR10923 TaxID=3236992 RepID=UPI0034CEFB7C